MNHRAFYLSLVFLNSSIAHSDIVSGTANIHDINATINSLSIIDTGNTLQTAPNTINITDTALAISASTSSGLNIETGVRNHALTSDIDNSAGSKSTLASTELTSTSINTGLLQGFSLTADSIQSQSLTQGDYSTLSSSGSTEIINGTLSVFGLADIVIPVLPEENFVLFNNGALSVILNEQITFGDNLETLGLTVNALHISFNGFLLGTDTLNGDIIMGQSSTSQVGISSVPAPTSLSLLLVAFIGSGFMRAKRFLAGQHYKVQN